MFLRLTIIFSFILLTTSCSQNTHSHRFLNLDFEKSANGRAVGWHQGSEGYSVFVDSNISYSGNKSLCIKKTGVGKFGLATSPFPIDDARGKHLIYTGYIKTENINVGYAGLWWRVDGSSGILNFDNMNDRGPSGTINWTKYTIELEIDKKATNINFGVLLPGDGTAWFDNLQIELDGKIYEQLKPEIIKLSAEQLNWLNNNVITFDTSDPNHSNNDLEFLKTIIGDARIVSLGEGTHGTSEFFNMKHRLTKFVVEEMGFTVFVMEANMPEAELVNEYVLSGKGNAKDVLTGLYFWTWNTQEVLDMIEWMREFNASGKDRIEFLGFDMQYPIVAIENVKKFIGKYDPGFYEEVENNYRKILEYYNETSRQITVSNIFAEQHYNYAKTVYDMIVQKSNDYYEVASKENTDWIIQNSRIVIQSIESKMQNKATRDESMASNVEWILEHKPDNTKIVLWAHNGHVSKKETNDRKPMGSFLSEKYGKQMIVFGFGFHEGKYTAVGDSGLGIYTTSESQPGSLEWMLHSTGTNRLFFDLRKLHQSSFSFLTKTEIDFRSIGSRAVDYAFYSTIIPDEFDIIIYFDKTTPSKCFNITDKNTSN